MSLLHEDGALSFLVRRAWLSMRSAIEAELKAYGLSAPQYATLMIVDDVPGCSNAAIARKVASTRQSANEMLSGLERDGLIERRPHPADRRMQELHITAAGRRRLAEARVAVTRREAEIEAAVPPDVRETARVWLEEVSEACDRLGA